MGWAGDHNLQFAFRRADVKNRCPETLDVGSTEVQQFPIMFRVDTSFEPTYL